jgi:hypothetical protein
MEPIRRKICTGRNHPISGSNGTWLMGTPTSEVDSTLAKDHQRSETVITNHTWGISYQTALSYSNEPWGNTRNWWQKINICRNALPISILKAKINPLLACWAWAETQAYSEREKSVVGGSGVVQEESFLVGGLKGCYWWKTVWRTRELHYHIQTENIKQLRVACNECAFTVYCGCYDNVLHWITLNSSEHTKAYCLLFVQWLWNKCFQDD